MRGSVDADPEPGEAAPALLEACERLAGAVALAQRDQRLDVERLAPVGRELLHGDRLHPLPHPRQRGVDRAVVAVGEVDEGESREAERLPDHEPRALRLAR